MGEVRGYKVFNPDWTCRGFKFEVGKTFEEDVVPECCSRGFHFCEKAADCFGYYCFDPDNKVAEIIALGEVVSGGKKSCTNKIKIVREIPWNELLMLVNTGKDCTGNRNSGNRNSGDCNSGDCNSGDCNSGNRNSGNRNSGDCNSGDWNSGNRNSGDWNSGDWNSGNCNSGDCNSGNWNSGDWNKTKHSNGCFNTEIPKIYMFNKLSDWTYEDWKRSDAKEVLYGIPSSRLNWIYAEKMTDEEKSEHPEYTTTDGYLKFVEEEKTRQEWWDELSDEDKKCVLSLPNFDGEIFKEITGITVL